MWLRVDTKKIRKVYNINWADCNSFFTCPDEVYHSSPSVKIKRIFYGQCHIFFLFHNYIIFHYNYILQYKNIILSEFLRYFDGHDLSTVKVCIILGKVLKVDYNLGVYFVMENYRNKSSYD